MTLGAEHTGRRRAAFTLLEVVIAMAVLGLLAGTIFAIVYRAADAASEIREYDSRDEQVSRFLALLRQSIEGLPSTGKMALAPPEETNTGFYELTFSDAVTAFNFGEMPGRAGETVIGMRPVDPGTLREDLVEQSEGATFYEVAISREDFAPGEDDEDGMVFRQGLDDGFLQADEEGRYWLPLLDYVTSMSWRFWDEENREWIDQWEDDSKMPPLIELSMADAYRTAPVTVVFEVPDHLTEAQDAQNTQNASGGSSGSTPAATSTTGGGGGPARPGGDGGGPPGRPRVAVATDAATVRRAAGDPGLAHRVRVVAVRPGRAVAVRALDLPAVEADVLAVDRGIGGGSGGAPSGSR